MLSEGTMEYRNNTVPQYSIFAVAKDNPTK